MPSNAALTPFEVVQPTHQSRPEAARGSRVEDRPLVGGRHLLILGTLLTSSGCQAITTIFETGVWVGVILVLLVLGAVAFIVSKFRGRGGPRGGMTAVALGLLGTVLSAGAPAQSAVESRARGGQEQVAGQQQRPGSPALDDVRLQGCVARDDGWHPREREPAVADGKAPSPAGSRGEMFVLRGVNRIEGAVDEPASGASLVPAQTYRLAPRAGLGLSTFEGQRVEVRGRLRSEGAPDDQDATSPSPDHRNSQVVQGGQMQDVGQTMSGGQGRQSGQSTESPRTPSTSGSDGATADALQTLVVMSVRTLAPTCEVR